MKYLKIIMDVNKSKKYTKNNSGASPFSQSDYLYIF